MEFRVQFVAQPSTRFSRVFDGIKHYFLLHARCFVFVLLTLCTLSASPVYADDKAILAQLDVIQSLSDRDNDEGLRQLIAFNNNLPPDASPSIRLSILNILSGLYFDAGKSKLGLETVHEFERLARQLKDKEALLTIEVFVAYDIFEKSGNEAALAHLEKLRTRVLSSASVSVQFRYRATLAAFYSNAVESAKAIQEYFEMLKLAEQLPRRQLQARMGVWVAISGLYMQLKDPVKALAATTEALSIASDSITPKAFIELTLQRGAVLSSLKRNDEALKEYENALRVAKEQKLPYFVASSLFSIADQYLIKKDFKRAEEMARASIEQSQVLEDEWGVIQAKINLGFAIGGQGKVKQGAELVNASLVHFKKADAKSDVELILDELSRMYENAGLYKEALIAVREQQKLNDEIFQSDRTKTVAALQEQFDAENRKKQIELLAKGNALKDADIKNHQLRQMVTLLASLVAGLAGCFIYMLYRRSKRLNQELQEVNSQLEFHAVRDPLTGLYNRRSFIALMSTRGRIEVERREGAYANPDCMILLDIDHFKHINDTWGHAVGDVVLKEIATRLRNVVRDEDMLMRWGGEEFLIFSPKSNPEQITSLVDRVLRTIGETAFMNGNLAIPVTVTAGFISVPFSDVPEDVCDWERALQIADMALYLGKTHGRNRAYGLSKLLVPHEDAIPTLTHDLAAGIKQNMVEVIEVLGPPQAHTHTFNLTHPQ